MEDKVLKFEFTADEANVILNALGQRPYVESFGIIEKIKTQAAPQLQAAPAADTTVVDSQ